MWFSIRKRTERKHDCHNSVMEAAANAGARGLGSWVEIPASALTLEDHDGLDRNQPSALDDDAFVIMNAVTKREDIGYREAHSPREAICILGGADTGHRYNGSCDGPDDLREPREDYPSRLSAG